MGYHILLATRENFDASIKIGVYGGKKSIGTKKSAQLNSEIISSFSTIRPGDFILFYVKNVGVYGLWKAASTSFYDETPILSDPQQIYPYRICFEPTVRKFLKPIALSDVLDLKDKGKIWTFDLGIFTRKNHNPITTEEGKEFLRLLLRNNPVFYPAGKIPNPYFPKNPRPLLVKLDCDNKGRIRYEGYLSAWFTKAFAQGKLKNIVGEYKDFINYVPTSFNTVMDIFLTHVTTVDSIDILHKFTCIELKTGTAIEKDLNQILKYEDWLTRKIAGGDAEMVQSILVAHELDNDVRQYVAKRKTIEDKTVRLIRYEINANRTDVVLHEI